MGEDVSGGSSVHPERSPMKGGLLGKARVAGKMIKAEEARYETALSGEVGGYVQACPTGCIEIRARCPPCREGSGSGSKAKLVMMDSVLRATGK